MSMAPSDHCIVHGSPVDDHCSWLCCRWLPLFHKKATIVLISYLPLSFNRPKRLGGGGGGGGCKTSPNYFATSNCCRLISCHETNGDRREIDLLTLYVELTLRAGNRRVVGVQHIEVWYS